LTSQTCELIAINQVWGTNHIVLRSKYVARHGDVYYWTTRVLDFYPYFYLKPENLRYLELLFKAAPALRSKCLHAIHKESGKTDWHAQDVVRIEVKLPGFVRMFKELLWGQNSENRFWQSLRIKNPLEGVTTQDSFDVYQADVPYERAFMADKGIVRHFSVSFDLMKVNCGHRHIKGVPFDKTFEGLKVPITGVDLEVVSGDGKFPAADEAKWPIVSVALSSHKGFDGCPEEMQVITTLPVPTMSFRHKEYGTLIKSKRVGSEWELIRLVMLAIGQSEVCLVWNEDFDVTYLLNRAKNIGMNRTACDALRYHVQVLDGMQAFRMTHLMRFRTKLKEAILRIKQFKPESAYLLPKVSEAYLEFRRKQRGDNINEMIEAKDWTSLLFYNASDVLDMWAVGNASGYAAQYQLWRWQGLAKMQNLYKHKSKLDPTTLTFANLNNVALPSSKEHEHVEAEGAPYVFDAVVGEIHKNVMVADVSRFYASIIISERVSPEFPDTEVDKDTYKKLFKKMPDGSELDKPDFLLVALCRYLVDGRNKAEARAAVEGDPAKKAFYEQQGWALKTATSGLWGYMAHETSRIYRPWAKDLILKTASWFIRGLAHFLEKKGFLIIYGDTDSVFVKRADASFIEPIPFTKLCNKIMVSLCKKKQYKTMIYAKPEKNAKFAMFFTKKHYALWMDWKDGKALEEPKLMLKGVAAIRGDYPRWGSKFQTDLITKMFVKADEVEGDVDLVLGFVDEILKESYTEIQSMLRERQPGNMELLARPLTVGKQPYIREAVGEWNEKYPDDPISKGSKVFVFPLRRKRWLVAGSVDRLSDEDYTDLESVSLVYMNIIDRAKTVLEPLGYPEEYIKMVARGDRIARGRSI